MIITLICIFGLIGVGLYFLKSIMPISGVPVTNTIEISSDEDFILHEFPGSVDLYPLSSPKYMTF